MIIPAGDPKQCCGVFLLEIVDAKSVSGSLHQNPVVPLLHDVFVRISASAASRATCARSLYENFLYRGLLVQDLCMRISCAYLCVKTSAKGSCMTTLYADLLRKISVSGSLHQGPVGV